MPVFLLIPCLLLALAAAFCLIVLWRIARAHREQFKRADAPENQPEEQITYADFSRAYPRETLHIPSGNNTLCGFLYGACNRRGLIVISSGHRVSAQAYLQNMKYFVDRGWMVLCYDYTGYYASEGKTMIDYGQAVHDLDAVLSFLEQTERFEELPILLYGHSLGAYVSAAVLLFHHRVSAVVAASGFDQPAEQWGYSVKRFSGWLGGILGPMAAFYLRVAFGKETVRLSSVDGINAVDIPVLVVSGTQDEYYGGES